MLTIIRKILTAEMTWLRKILHVTRRLDEEYRPVADPGIGGPGGRPPPLGATIFFLTTQVTSHRQLDMRVHQVNTKFYAFFNDLIIKINIFLEVRSLCK